MTKQAKHLSDEELLIYLAGNLSDEEAYKMELHISSCDHCAKVLSNYHNLGTNFNQIWDTWTAKQQAEELAQKHQIPNFSKEKPHSSYSFLTSIKGILENINNHLSKPVIRWAAVSISIMLIFIVTYNIFIKTAHTQELLIGEIAFQYKAEDVGSIGFAEQEQRIRTRGISRGPSSESQLILTQNDQYALTVNPKSNIFLYVFQWDNNGQMSVLFPNMNFVDHDNPLIPGRNYRIPQTGNWFTLDDNPGLENIGIIASQFRIKSIEYELGKLLIGDNRSKEKSSTRIREFIIELEKKSLDDYYVKRFSFIHKKKGTTND